MKKVSIAFSILLIGIFIGGFGACLTQTLAAEKMPDAIVIAGFQSGSGMYPIGVAVANAVKAVTGIRARMIPTASDMGKAIMVRSKDAHVIVTGGGGSVPMALGSQYGGFDVPEWGPQPLRLLWRGANTEYGMITRPDTGIKVPSDIRGKKAAWWTANPVSLWYLKGFLAFAGLTTKDVTLVPSDTFEAAVVSVGEKAADVCPSSVGSSASQQVFKMPSGGKWIPYPQSDKEGWKRLMAETPYFFPATVEAPIPTIEKGEKLEAAAYGTHVFTYSWLPDNVAYEITRSMAEGYDSYKHLTPRLAKFKLDDNFASLQDEFIPFHPGSVEYLKKIGRWTPAYQAWQERQLAKLNELRTAFEAKIK